MHRPSRRLLATLAALSALALGPTRAEAQSSTGELTLEGFDHRVWGDFGFFYRHEGLAIGPFGTSFDFWGFQPSLYGTFTLARPADEVVVQLDAAWRLGGLAGTSSAFRAANPYVGARAGVHHGRENDQWRARGGAGLTLPLTNLYDDFSGTPGGPTWLWIAVLPGMQGVYDAWLETPLNMALVFRGDFEYRGEFFSAGGDAALAALFPVTYQGRTGDTVMDLQMGAWGAGRPIPELALGLRLQAVALVTTARTTGSNTEGYVSLMPFVRAELARGRGFAEARWLLNLDPPYGFSLDGGIAVPGTGRIMGVWSLQLSGGASF